MKKTIFVALLFVFASFLNSCGSDDPGIDCLSLSTNALDAASTFGESRTTESCNAYKTALQNYLNNNCSPDAATEASFREQLDALGDCTIL
ncbi:hypothetical protein D1816_16560 [Aquimarina sp. AD10]|uniref:Lipoprotein n=1 Tax=Aquimarina aggregata TaxID=1642818 RepID=A0A162Z5D0_9FLAO|nr:MULTISPECIES: hypothetical protein [Aquimarina]AXT61900.1 hypothetical protein D1816_16560 [Aquimarina sp. AD10]KZS39575.1 hypothetical protein AWE51_07935 [Aquimarina aggregata]RKN02360.1 hypothetical protein D7033_00675 [Aquimarina sp. AD10]